MTQLYQAYKLATQRNAARKTASMGTLIKAVGGLPKNVGASAKALSDTPWIRGAASKGFPLSSREALALNVGSSGLAGMLTGYGADSAYGTLTGNDSPGVGAAIGGLLGAASGFGPSRGHASYLYRLLASKGVLADTARQATAYGAAVPIARGVQSAAGSEYDVTRPIQTMVRPAQEKQRQIEQQMSSLARLRDKYKWLLG